MKYCLHQPYKVITIGAKRQTIYIHDTDNANLVALFSTFIIFASIISAVTLTVPCRTCKDHYPFKSPIYPANKRLQYTEVHHNVTPQELCNN